MTTFQIIQTTRLGRQSPTGRPLASQSAALEHAAWLTQRYAVLGVTHSVQPVSEPEKETGK